MSFNFYHVFYMWGFRKTNNYTATAISSKSEIMFNNNKVIKLSKRYSAK